MSTTYDLGIIGAGAMGAALARGFVTGGAASCGQIMVSDVREEVRTTLAAEGFAATADNQQLVDQSAVILLVVKPQVLAEVLKPLRIDPGKLVISFAAGVTLARLAELLGDGRPLIRVMPNILAVVSEAASAYTGNAYATEAHLELARQLLCGIGTAVPVEEKLMDAVTGLSGSGPAFVASFAEAMIDGGVAAGLPRAQAAQLAAQTIRGVGRWLQETGQSPAQLKDLVTSPGGTTIAGLRRLEGGGLRSAIIEAVVAAAERSRELGK